MVGRGTRLLYPWSPYVNPRPVSVRSLGEPDRPFLPCPVFAAQANLLRAMCVSQDEYTSPRTLRVCVGTYNVNGGKHFRSVAYKDQNLADWLLDAPRIARGQGTFCSTGARGRGTYFSHHLTLTLDVTVYSRVSFTIHPSAAALYSSVLRRGAKLVEQG